MFTLRDTFYPLIKKTTKISLMASVISASAFSAASFASGVKIFESIDMNQRADSERPGERVDDYLGQNVGPEFWQDENRAVEQSIAQCMEKRGHQYSADVTKASASLDTDVDTFAALAANEPRRFEKIYGYGITAELQQETRMRESAASISSSSNADKSKVMTKDYADAQDACASIAVNKIIRPKLAPKEVHEAYRALLAQAAKTSHYQNSTLAFGKCLTRSELGPIKSGRELVMEKAFALAGQPSIAESGEVRKLALTPEQLGSLQAFERKVFEVEDDCGQASGLYDAMYGLETNLIANLRDRFPSFAGVVK